MGSSRPYEADYENQLLVDVVYEKSRLVTSDMIADFPSKDSAQRAAFLAMHERERVEDLPRILDFGGACGLHYKMAIATGVSVRWAVVETPTMAKKAESGGRAAHIRYFDKIAAARSWLGGIDCVYSSSAIQYVSDPENVTAILVELDAPVIVWARLNLTDGPTQTIEQTSRLAHNGPGPLPPQFEDCEIRYPCTLISERDFIDWHTGYEVTDRSGPLDNATIYFRRKRRLIVRRRVWPFG